MPRLDRHLAQHLSIKRSDVRLLLAQGRVDVDGSKATEASQIISRFSTVRCDGDITQALTPRYVMLNKPAGVVSATKDPNHRTVIDLLTQTWRDQLHIVGRLDFNSTGLMLLTNDGAWSKRLSLPATKLRKRYRVCVEQPLCQSHIEAFREGLYFAYEDLVTRPAELILIDTHNAEVELIEGRYHQIKRMFGHFNNKVLSIHRSAVGPIALDSELAPGQSRSLTAQELHLLQSHNDQ